MKKLFIVKYMLASWTGYAEYLVELTEQEVEDLKLIFEASKREHKLWSWEFRPADVKNASSIKDILADDIKHQNEEEAKNDEGASSPTSLDGEVKS